MASRWTWIEALSDYAGATVPHMKRFSFDEHYYNAMNKRTEIVIYNKEGKCYGTRTRLYA